MTLEAHRLSTVRSMLSTVCRKQHAAVTCAAVGFALAIFPLATAEAFQVKDCGDAGVGIENIASAATSLYGGKATAYLVDTVEPACCSSGVAIVVPALEAESPVGGNVCWTVTGFSSIDLAKAKRSYDKGKGLLLEMSTRVPNESGDIAPGAPLKLRINFSKARVEIE
jgi:hypothetical protein